MEKQQEAAQDSISSVGVQIKEYPPSEVFTSEPPPAYVRPRATAVQIARIAAVTLITVSFILGFFMLASAYVTATATCYVDYPQQQQDQAIDDRPQYQSLVAMEPLDSEESAQTKNDHVSLAEPERDQQAEQQTQQQQEQPIQLKLPLQLDFDEIAGAMMEKNQRSRMNCVVEKRRAEEVTDHQPRTVRLPFGLNMTSDPRYEHVTGERMAIFCESGNDQRHVPMEQQMTPIVVPIPIHQVPMHPNAIPQMPIHQNAIPHHQLPPQFHGHQMRPEMREMREMRGQPIPQMMQVQQEIQVEAAPAHQFPVHQFPGHQGPVHQVPIQELRQLHHLPPQFHPHQAAVQQALQALEQQALHQSPEEHQVIIQEEEVMPVMRAFPEQQMEEVQVPSDTVKPPPPPFHRLPLHHQQGMQQQQLLAHQQQPQPQPLQLQQLQEELAVPQQEARPHFVQPRSVRSVDGLLHREKRVKRCSCDCSC